MKTVKQTLLVLFAFLITLSIAHPGKVVKKMKAPYSFSTGLTYDGTNLWLADYKADKLVAINPTSGVKVREIASPGFWPEGLTWDGKNLWNVDRKQKKIFKVDPDNGTILKMLDSPASSPAGLTWDGNTIWIADHRSDEIMKIDLSDGTAIQSFDAPAGYVQGLTFDGTYLWCSDRIEDEIYMVDPQNGEVILIVKAPAPYPRGLAWDGEFLWNVDYQSDSLYKIVRKDDENYVLEDKRVTRVTLTHETKVYGKGNLLELNSYLAIPENLPQQKILKKEFSPQDFSTVEDRWDQTFAHFQTKNIMAPGKVQSQMVVEAEISDINYFIFPDECGTIADIPKDLRQTYTANGSKYLLDDPYIQNLSKKIVGDEKNPYWIARHIFDYVRNHLEYALEGGWNVAPVVLKRGTGSCSEYTFSFIALCRAAGLPARYVGSIVVRGDDASFDEVFHRWPEIYLPNYGWIPIDPQGGDKKRPRDRAMNIGHLSNRFLITTQGGGDSKYMGWYYNSYETYKFDPQVKINIETFGEWEPLNE